MPTEREKQGTVAIIVGMIAAVLLYVLILGIVFGGRPDAQSGLAVCFGPFYSLWFGMSVGFIALGNQQIDAANREHRSPGVAPRLFVVIGVIGALWILGFLASEYHQMTHPTRLPLPH
jgi:F0F1-type ATP synthase membrane subunit c/vacuolar-type H+-ATPase subunit K